MLSIFESRIKVRLYVRDVNGGFIAVYVTQSQLFYLADMTCYASLTNQWQNKDDATEHRVFEDMAIKCMRMRNSEMYNDRIHPPHPPPNWIRHRTLVTLC